MAKEEMLTTGKLAETLGVSPKKIKDAIEQAGIQPAMKKGACCYYSKVNAEKIKKILNK